MLLKCTWWIWVTLAGACTSIEDGRLATAYTKQPKADYRLKFGPVQCIAQYPNCNGIVWHCDLVLIACYTIRTHWPYDILEHDSSIHCITAFTSYIIIPFYCLNILLLLTQHYVQTRAFKPQKTRFKAGWCDDFNRRRAISRAKSQPKSLSKQTWTSQTIPNHRASDEIWTKITVQWKPKKTS